MSFWKRESTIESTHEDRRKIQLVLIEMSSVSQDLSKNDMDLCKKSEVDTEATVTKRAQHREDVLMRCVR